MRPIQPSIKETAMNIKNPVRPTVNFVKKHRVSIAVTATSIFWMYVMSKSAASFNEFLKENDLFDTYYAMSEID